MSEEAGEAASPAEEATNDEAAAGEAEAGEAGEAPFGEEPAAEAPAAGDPEPAEAGEVGLASEVDEVPAEVVEADAGVPEAQAAGADSAGRGSEVLSAEPGEPVDEADQEGAATTIPGDEALPDEELAAEHLGDLGSADLIAERPEQPAGTIEGEVASEHGEEAARQSPESPGMGAESPSEGGIDSAMIEAGGSGDEDSDEHADQEEAEEEESDKPDPVQELQEKLDQLHELNECALQHNVALQRRVIQRKMQDKSYDASEKQSEGKVTESKYQTVLQNVHTVRMKLRLQQVKAARMSEELKNQLEGKRQKAIQCRDSFQEFKRQVARHAEYARTGKKIPEKIIQEVEEFELDKDAEVEEVRGSNISLKNRLAKLEQALRKKDELAENLHVIDFEQLKIENQTLNEKIEERNEELHKLRKKTVVTVQIITHMREKVQFVQQDYQVLKAELAQLDQDLAAQRDLVAKTKHERDEHRSEHAKLKQQTGIMGSEHLTKDFDSRTERIKSLKDDISKLKRRHQQMLGFIKQHGG